MSLSSFGSKEKLYSVLKLVSSPVDLVKEGGDGVY